MHVSDLGKKKKKDGDFGAVRRGGRCVMGKRVAELLILATLCGSNWWESVKLSPQVSPSAGNI